MTTPQPERTSARDYPRLFAAMNEVLRELTAGGNEKEALERSFDAASEGFGAEKSLLLIVEEHEPLRLRRGAARGLTEAQVQACERGESVKGVSSSVIRAVIASREARVVENPLFNQSDETPALAGHNYSVLCTPILDPVRDVVIAVLYFQNAGLDYARAYKPADAVWAEGYAAALGRTFGYSFEEQRRKSALRDLLQGEDPPRNAPEIIGDSAHTQELRRLLHEVYIPAADAPDPDPVLILGEKGTGKDLVARYIHAYGARRDRPFVPVNCAELTDEMAAARFFGHKKGAFTGALTDEPGFFRAAHRGVLFLDEIGELSPRAQATLLRVLENRTVVTVGETRETKVDVLVVLATNRDPDTAVADGVIRADLYDRFKVQAIRLAPLRDRPWDVPALARHFIAHHEARTRTRTLGLTPEALRAFVSYSWPGNVREVARVASALVSHARGGGRLDVERLRKAAPDVLTSGVNPKAGPVLWEDVPLRDAVRTFERELILARLERHGWDVPAARASLGLPKTTFHRAIADLGIVLPAHRRDREDEA